MRFKYQGTMKDGNGRVVGSSTTSDAAAGTCSVYLAGTSTAASVYAASAGGTAVNSVSTDSDGMFEFWVDDGDYDSTQRFKITLSHADFESKSYDDLDIILTSATNTEINKYCDESAKAVVSITAATASLTQATHSHKIVTLDRAAGTTITLPEATGTGDTYTIIVGTACTSNSYIINTADSTNADYVGVARGQDMDDDTVTNFAAEQADGFDVITMNRTTTGGHAVGSAKVVLIDIATDVWRVEMDYHVPTGSNPATPFSST